MKKTLLLSITAIFAMVLFFNVASAAITVTGTTTNLAQDSNNFTVTLVSTVNESVTLSITNIGTLPSAIDFASISPVTLINNTPKDVVIHYQVQSGFNFELGEPYTTNLIVTDSNSSTYSKSISFANTYCEDVKNIDRLEVSNLEINTVDGFGDDDNYWYLRDTVEISFDVENRGVDIDSMDVDWAIYNTNNKKIMDGSEAIKDLDRNDDTTITFQVKLDENIDDFDREDAIVYVKAFGKINDRDSSYNNKETCDSDSQSVDVITSDDFVIADNFMINDKELEDGDLSDGLTCGSEVSASAQLYNIGDSDQSDVYVEVYSKELGLYKKIDIGDIDSYDSANIDFTFKLPEEMDTAKTYKIQYEVFDDNNDVFENKEDDKAVFYNYFKAVGDCITVAPTVGAELVGDAFSGSEMIVKATIRNNEPNPVVYTLSADKFDSWADGVSISPQVISLEIGEEKTVEFKFNVLKDAVGDKEFSIEATDNGKVVLSQNAAVTIEKKGFSFNALKDKENLKLAGIIALNLIFVILIIIVARKILRRK